MPSMVPKKADQNRTLFATVVVAMLLSSFCAASSSSSTDVFYSTVELSVSALPANITAAQLGAFSTSVRSAAVGALRSAKAVNVLLDTSDAFSGSTATIIINTIAIATTMGESVPTYERMKTWTSAGGFSIFSAVRSAAVSALAVLPSDVSFSSGSLSVPCRGSCDSDVEFTVTYSLGVTTTSLRGGICTTMGIPSCDSLVFLATDTTTGTSRSAVILTNTNNSLAAFMQFVSSTRQNHFQLTSMGITTISLLSGSSAVLVYSRTEDVNPNAPPAEVKCDPITLFWPILLVILVPIAYIVFRQVYHYGKKQSIAKERRALRQAEGLPPDPPQMTHHHYSQRPMYQSQFTPQQQQQWQQQQWQQGQWQQAQPQMQQQQQQQQQWPTQQQF